MLKHTLAEMKERAGLAERRPSLERIEDWPEPSELPPRRPSAPSMPEKLVPEPLRAWCVDIAERASIPLEYPAIPALIAAGALIGRAIGLQPNRYQDFVVVPNLWGMIVGRPGAMKTYALTEPLRPVDAIETGLRDDFDRTATDTQAQRARFEAEIDALKMEMRTAARGRGEGTASLDQLQAALATKSAQLAEVPAAPRRITTNDATVEKLGELLRDNPRGILLVRDELSGWLHALERQGREGDRQFFLEAWNGTGRFTVDRIGRGSIHIPGLTVSICGGIQPDVLARWINDGGNDGLVARFQLTVWPDSLGEWRRVDKWPDSVAKRRARDVYDRLYALSGADVDTVADERGIPFVRFDDDAEALFDEWRDELESRLRSVELEATPAFEAHISKYRSLMPKLAMIFRLIELAPGERDGRPTLANAQLAATWCDYLELHARKLYGSEINAGGEAAHLLMERIRRTEIRDGDTVRDIYRRHWSGLVLPSTVHAGLQALAEAGIVRLDEIETGGRPTDVVRINPALTGAAR